MSLRLKKSITLIELLVSLVLLSMIVLSISQIDVFSTFHVISATRRVKIDNEVSLALEHMTKDIVKAFGNEINAGADNVIITVKNNPPIDDNNTIRFKIDNDNDGSAETWRAYLYHNNSAPLGQNQIWYCPQCTDGSPCTTCNPAWGTDANNIIARNISLFMPCKPVAGNDCAVAGQLIKNYVTIQIRACWDPASAESRNNPCVNMNANINLPAVSTN